MRKIIDFLKNIFNVSIPQQTDTPPFLMPGQPYDPYYENYANEVPKTPRKRAAAKTKPKPMAVYKTRKTKIVGAA